MPNAQLLLAQHAHPLVHNDQPGQLGQLSSSQSLSGLPPLAQNKVPLGFIQQSQSQPSSSLVPSPGFRLDFQLSIRFYIIQHCLDHQLANSQLHPQHSSQLVVPIQPCIMTHKLCVNSTKSPYEVACAEKAIVAIQAM